MTDLSKIESERSTGGLPRPHKLPPLVIVGAAIFLFAGETASGTGLLFSLMACVAVLAACVTYNLLGGLSSLGGIAFAVFALRTFVISQFAKVVVLERADQGLRVPQLTITIYALFFVSLMVGVFVLGQLRLPLPRPAEPETTSQRRFLYYVALIGGTFGSVAVVVMNMNGGSGVASTSHGMARALSGLLPLALILAVDERIRVTHGEHCFGWRALWPTFAISALGFADVARAQFMEPLVVVVVTAYLRGYRFKARHYFTILLVAGLFARFISPFYLYARSITRSEVTFSSEFMAVARQMMIAPSHWAEISQESSEAGTGDNAPTYFNGVPVLNRFSLISTDSTLIEACSRGYHYGSKALILDLRTQLPRFIDPGKPEFGSGPFLGHLDGMESDQFETTFSTITVIPDSYGAFGWLGAIIYPLMIMPWVFVIFDSMFDYTKPWGTVGLVVLILSIAEGSMGEKIMGLMIREPISVLLISWIAAAVSQMFPSGDKQAYRFEADSAALISQGD